MTIHLKAVKQYFTTVLLFCLFFNFTPFVILENLDLPLSGMKGFIQSLSYLLSSSNFAAPVTSVSSTFGTSTQRKIYVQLEFQLSHLRNKHLWLEKKRAESTDFRSILHTLRSCNQASASYSGEV